MEKEREDKDDCGRLEERAKVLENVNWPDSPLKEVREKLKLIEDLLGEVEIMFEKTGNEKLMRVLSVLINALSK